MSSQGPSGRVADELAEMEIAVAEGAAAGGGAASRAHGGSRAQGGQAPEQ